VSSADLPTKPEIITGTYTHYKGGRYEVLDVVIHSETLEWLVLYRHVAQDDEGYTWVRPYDMFVGVLEVDGVLVRRFTPVVAAS